jgi:predicted nucleotide-binding protein
MQATQDKTKTHLSIIEQLWSIIDDIDTYNDMAKNDDKAFRAMVERRQKDRWSTGITTDGYNLTIPD